MCPYVYERPASFETRRYFNLPNFQSSPNCQFKLHIKFSSYTAFCWQSMSLYQLHCNHLHSFFTSCIKYRNVGRRRIVEDEDEINMEVDENFEGISYTRVCVCMAVCTYVCMAVCTLVLGGIIFLLPVYGITNSERYSVFHGI